MKNTLTKMLVLSLSGGFLLTGCNTVRGIGSDIASVGNSIINTANQASYNNQMRKNTTQNNPQNNPATYTQPQTYNNYDPNYNTTPTYQ
ncbi:hypothetical protein MOMA_07721 [Moraxella macacae 0408225]|uniref:Entericidin EcnAB n=1 Tax=Moraxella macacae 0408225 TaxID=1230338 RepID=L2F5X4_9GAMM|nr:hypothetical protein [Moraxella macacae]ELA08432.1 hypothetical protein MOMA_07721 [Moraxella macacae 0408225]